MIDELEPKTRVISGAGKAINIVLVTFTADDDLTLRQVHMNGGVLSTDPTFARPADDQVTDELRLDSGLVASWTNLVFPLPKGRKLYWGGLGSVADSLITLVLT